MSTIIRDDLNVGEALKIMRLFREKTQCLDYAEIYKFFSQFNSRAFFTYERLYEKMLKDLVLDGNQTLKEEFDAFETAYFRRCEENKKKKVTLNIAEAKFEEFNKELLGLLAEAIVESLKKNENSVKIKISLDTIELYYGVKDCNKDLFKQDFACWSMINLNCKELKIKTGLKHDLSIYLKV